MTWNLREIFRTGLRNDTRQSLGPVANSVQAETFGVQPGHRFKVVGEKSGPRFVGYDAFRGGIDVDLSNHCDSCGALFDNANEPLRKNCGYCGTERAYPWIIDMGAIRKTGRGENMRMRRRSVAEEQMVGSQGRMPDFSKMEDVRVGESFNTLRLMGRDVRIRDSGEVWVIGGRNINLGTFTKASVVVAQDELTTKGYNNGVDFSKSMLIGKNLTLGESNYWSTVVVRGGGSLKIKGYSNIERLYIVLNEGQKKWYPKCGDSVTIEEVRFITQRKLDLTEAELSNLYTKDTRQLRKGFDFNNKIK